MIILADGQLEGTLGAMCSAGAGRHVADYLPVLPIQVGAVLFIAAAPTAHADDLVEFFPFWKGIAGGMEDNHSASVGHVLFKRCLGFRGPFVARVVAHNQFIGGEIRLKLAEVLTNIEVVSLSGWRQAVAKYHLDIDFYAHQQWDTNDKLPWSVLDSGTEPEKLKLELTKAMP